MSGSEEWTYTPAADHGLSGRVRWRSARREAGWATIVAGRIARSLVRRWLRWRYRLRVSGLQHVPGEVPCVFVANHTSHLDTLAILCALPPRIAARTTPLAAGDAFFSGPLRARLAGVLLNARPVWRERRAAAAFAEIRRLLRDRPGGLILFPEGTRSRDGTLRAFRGGIGCLVAGTDVPVVPIAIQGAHACWPPGERRPRPRADLVLSFGAPRTFTEAPTGKESWLRIAASLQADVRSLGGPVAAEEGEESVAS